jgi:hypothetical protein
MPQGQGLQFDNGEMRYTTTHCSAQFHSARILVGSRMDLRVR